MPFSSLDQVMELQPSSLTRTSKVSIRRYTHKSLKPKRAWVCSSNNSPSRAALVVMLHPRLRAVFTRAGELGYSISHAFGAVFDHPDLIALTMVGDGEAETGPLATSWHSNKFLNPITDGAVLPVLHLNGYKINNPTLLARISHAEIEALFVGMGWTPYFVEGSDLPSMHQAMAATLEKCVTEIKAYQKQARDSGKCFSTKMAHDCVCAVPRAGLLLERFTITTLKDFGVLIKSQ